MFFHQLSTAGAKVLIEVLIRNFFKQRLVESKSSSKDHAIKFSPNSEKACKTALSKKYVTRKYIFYVNIYLISLITPNYDWG